MKNKSYHSLQMFLPFHWVRAHHVTYKSLPTNNGLLMPNVTQLCLPTTKFLGARYHKKEPTYQYLSNMQKRGRSWKVKEIKMSVYLKLTWSVPFYTQYRKSSVIKQTVSNFFHLIFHLTVKICFHSLILNCFVSIHFFVTSEKKLLIDLETP